MLSGFTCTLKFLVSGRSIAKESENLVCASFNVLLLAKSLPKSNCVSLSRRVLIYSGCLLIIAELINITKKDPYVFKKIIEFQVKLFAFFLDPGMVA